MTDNPNMMPCDCPKGGLVGTDERICEKCEGSQWIETTTPNEVRGENVIKELRGMIMSMSQFTSISFKSWEDFAQRVVEKVTIDIAIILTIQSEAHKAEIEGIYKRALDDMFLEIAKLAEPDERQFGSGDLVTNMDNIHDIKELLIRNRLRGEVSNG